MFNNTKRSHFRQEAIIVELMMDRNDPAIDFSNEIGCYNTPKTTLSPLAYNPDVSKKSYFFANQLIPNLTDIYFPNLESITQNTPELSIGENIGTRASGAIKISDFYTNDAFELPEAFKEKRVYASFWGKFIARNYIRNRRIAIYRGYVDENGFSLSNFQKELYIIRDISRDKNGAVTISYIDPLYYTNETKAKMPVKSNGKLDLDITSSQTTMAINSQTEGEYGLLDDPVTLRINTELVTGTVSSISTATNGYSIGINITERGYGPTSISDHKKGDLVQLCYVAVQKNVVDIIKDAFSFTKIDPAFIPNAVWDAEKEAGLSSYILSGVLSKPTEVKKVISDMIRHSGSIMAYDSVASLISLKANPEFKDPDLIVDDNIFEIDSVSIKELASSQVTRATINYDKRNVVSDDKEENYRRGYTFIDDLIESEGAFSDIQEAKVLNSNWLFSSTGDQKIAAEIINREVQRKAQIPFETKFTIDSEYVGLIKGEDQNIGSAFSNAFNQSEFGGTGEQILQSRRLWLGSVVQMTNHLLVGPDGKNLTYHGQVTKLQPKPFDKWDVTILSISSAPVVDFDYIIQSSATPYENLRLSDLYAPVSGRPTKILVEAGAVIGSIDTNTASLRTGVYPEGLYLANRGTIVGQGGNGGNVDSAIEFEPGVCSYGFQAKNGEKGGPALELECENVIIENGINGFIWGGGGGGGSISSFYGDDGFGNTVSYQGRAGSGGAGYTGGIAGIHLSLPEFNGLPGSFNGPGLGFVAGGSFGEKGNNGTIYACNQYRYPVTRVGGAAGPSIVSNGFVINIITGDRGLQIKGPRL